MKAQGDLVTRQVRGLCAGFPVLGPGTPYPGTVCGHWPPQASLYPPQSRVPASGPLGGLRRGCSRLKEERKMAVSALRNRCLPTAEADLAQAGVVKTPAPEGLPVILSRVDSTFNFSVFYTFTNRPPPPPAKGSPFNFSDD